LDGDSAPVSHLANRPYQGCARACSVFDLMQVRQIADAGYGSHTVNDGGYTRCAQQSHFQGKRVRQGFSQAAIGRKGFKIE
jgi:hypothetical protein